MQKRYSQFSRGDPMKFDIFLANGLQKYENLCHPSPNDTILDRPGPRGQQSVPLFKPLFFKKYIANSKIALFLEGISNNKQLFVVGVILVFVFLFLIRPFL